MFVSAITRTGGAREMPISGRACPSRVWLVCGLMMIRSESVRLRMDVVRQRAYPLEHDNGRPTILAVDRACVRALDRNTQRAAQACNLERQR
ncbi:hypothetical protein D9M68_793480 [compost metagenome]